MLVVEERVGIGSTQVPLQPTDGQVHVAHLPSGRIGLLPEDTDFKHCAANIELQPGAEISADSPCLVDYLGGRPVLNLTLEDRDLVVVNAGNKRNYSFHIELLK